MQRAGAIWSFWCYIPERCCSGRVKFDVWCYISHGVGEIGILALDFRWDGAVGGLNWSFWRYMSDGVVQRVGET